MSWKVVSLPLYDKGGLGEVCSFSPAAISRCSLRSRLLFLFGAGLCLCEVVS